MSSLDLAAQLVHAKSKRSLKRLIAGRFRGDDRGLANRIKDICLQNWTSRPTVARKAAQALREIAEMDPDTEVHALTAWVCGIAEITHGKLELAVSRLEEAVVLFSAIGKKHESAQPQVVLLMALAMLNRFDQAAVVGSRALRIFVENGNELAAGKIELNLHNIASGRSRYRVAEKLGLSAYNRFARINETGWQALAGNGLAITYTQLSEFRNAEKYFKAALETARAAGMLVTQAEIEASMGNLALFRGRYADALSFLELSRRKYDELLMPHQTAIAALEIADVYAELNLTDEALDLYASTTVKLRQLKLQAVEARARSSYGKAAIRLRKTAFSKSQFERALKLFESQKDHNGIATVMLNRAYLELTLHNYLEAETFAKKAARIFTKKKNERQGLMASWLIGEVLLNTGRARQGHTVLIRTLDDALRIEQKQIALLALNSLGKSSVIAGDSPAAKRFFKRAIRLTEHTRAPLPGEEFRITFLEGKLEPYQNLAKIYLSERRFRDALRFIEKGRSRSLIETVLRSDPASDIPADLALKVEGLREQLNQYYSVAKAGNEASSRESHLKIRKKERELSNVLRRAESTQKAASANQGYQRHDLDINKLQTQIGSKRVLIEYVTFGGVLSAIVLTDSRVLFFNELGLESEVLSLLEQLRFQFGALRYGRAAVDSFAMQLKQRADSYLSRLYDMLMRPLESAITDRDLIIVPTGVLHYLPFNALNDSSRYISETRSVTNAPAASIWQMLDAKPEPHPNRPLLMGFADANAPEAENEVRAIKKILPASQLYTGARATFAAFREKAPKHDILHLACHGQFRPDSPLFSSLHLADGRITVRDVAAQKLSADLVVLSACETGLNKLFAGDEIVGLTRGFLSAGVSSIIVSLWTVNDAASKGLMTAFYNHLQRGCSIATSLRYAQNDFIERGEHPYYWSPFVLIG